MFGRWRGSQTGKEQSDQEYHRALSTLHQQVQTVIANVTEISDNLASDYPKEALSRLSERFERISREFTSYTMATNNMFYGIVSRSNARKKTAKAVASRAKDVAKLFEKYSKKPNSYVRVDSRDKIHKLLIMLENLSSQCI
jgi:hypothetical protein